MTVEQELEPPHWDEIHPSAKVILCGNYQRQSFTAVIRPTAVTDQTGEDRDGLYAPLALIHSVSGEKK